MRNFYTELVFKTDTSHPLQKYLCFGDEVDVLVVVRKEGTDHFWYAEDLFAVKGLCKFTITEVSDHD